MKEIKLLSKDDPSKYYVYNPETLEVSDHNGSIIKMKTDISETASCDLWYAMFSSVFAKIDQLVYDVPFVQDAIKEEGL